MISIGQAADENIVPALCHGEGFLLPFLYFLQASVVGIVTDANPFVIITPLIIILFVYIYFV